MKLIDHIVVNENGRKVIRWHMAILEFVAIFPIVLDARWFLDWAFQIPHTWTFRVISVGVLVLLLVGGYIAGFYFRPLEKVPKA